MKRLLIHLLFSIFLFANGFSQISYSSADYASVGDTFVISTVNSGLVGLNVANTGANFSWVFDSLEVSDQNVLRIDDPDNTGYFLTWFAGCVLNQGNIFTCPGIWNDLTDQAVLDIADFGLGGIQLSNAYNFYKKTSSTYEATIYGASIGVSGVSVPVAVNYEDIDTLYQFPLTYLAKDSSFSRLRLDASAGGGTGITLVQEHKRINEVDGWGSLTTPFTTYSSVLRMKTTLINNDTIILNGNPVSVPNTEIQYKWFASGNGQPVMTATLNQTPLGDILTSIEFQDSLRCLPPNASFLYFPPVALIDSASGEASVNFFNQSGNSDQYTWNFGDGTSSSSFNPNHDFGPGIYQVQLLACNTVCNPLECDTFNLPLTVINTFAPLAVFNTDPDEGCVGDSVQFQNNSLNAQTYFWDFGDGSNSTAEAPAHLYASPDTYNVQFIAINGQYRDTTEREIIIHPQPMPDLGQDTLILPTDSSATLNPGSFDEYSWSTGDSSSILVLNGFAVGVDTLQIWVEVLDQNGCSQRDSIVLIGRRATSAAPKWAQQISIYPNPASDQLFVDMPGGLTSDIRSRVLDLNGKLVFEKDLKAGVTNSIDLGSLSQGFYFLQIESNGERVSRKFVVGR